MATSPVPDDERIHTFGLLIEAHARMTRLMDAELQASDGISLQTYEVLLRLGRSPDCRMTMTELAGAVSLTTGGVTRLADRLADEGLVERLACPTDRRVVHLGLTPKGRKVLTTATRHHLASLDEHLLARVDQDDLPAVHRFLDTLRHDPD